MIIRCERCSTLYELDEALLAPEGSPVQCTRCQAVFSARPPRPAPGEGTSAAPAPAAATPASAGTAPAGAPAPASPVAPPAASTAPATPAAPASPRPAEPAAAPARPVRTGPAVYRPPAPAQPPPPAATPGRRGTVGAFEARAQRANIGRRLIVPAAVVALLALLAGGTALWRRRPDPEALRLAAEATARLTQDDAGSLSRAVQLYDQLLARAPARGDAVAGRALARILMAAAQLEEAEPFAEQLAVRNAERERLLAEPQPGSEDAVRLLAVEATRLDGEVAPRRKAADALLAQASAELRDLAARPGGEVLAARPLAVQAALAGDREALVRQAVLARRDGPDAWVDLAEAWLELRAPAGREAALPALAKLAEAHPELVRARWLVARTQAAAGRREEASATLAGVLAANPRHERAQRLKAALAAAPVPAPAPPQAAPPQPAVKAPPQAWQRPATAPPVAPAAAAATTAAPAHAAAPGGPAAAAPASGPAVAPAPAPAEPVQGNAAAPIHEAPPAPPPAPAPAAPKAQPAPQSPAQWGSPAEPEEPTGG